MPHDPVRIEATRAWFERVQIDIRAAEVDIQAEPPLTDDAVFHCQQAVEKALKGFLTWHDEPFRKTHSIEELGAQCCAIDNTLSALLEEAAAFTEYATAFRYPGMPLQVDPSEARQSLELAREVVSAVMQRLPEEIV